MGDKVNNENFIFIQGWMIKELELKGNELMIYAIIYGFSQAENQVFNGSLQYLAEWTNSTKQGVMKNLKSLAEKGYITKKEKVINNVKFCEYYATKFNGVLNKVEWGGKQSLMGGIKQSLPNNININNIKNNKKYIYYGEYQNVFFTEEQYKKLINEFPDDYKERIEKLSGYMQSTGKKYKDCLATIRNWARNEKGKGVKKDGSTKKTNGSEFAEFV